MLTYCKTNAAVRLLIAAIASVGLTAGAQSAQAQSGANRLPLVVDLTKDQRPIRRQGARGTCIFHPEVEALEAAYHRRGIDVGLSVEQLIWNAHSVELNDKGTDVGANENSLANLGGGSMSERYGVLSRYGIGLAKDMLYRFNYDNPQADYFKGHDVSDFRFWEPFRQISLNRFNLDPHQLSQTARQTANYGIKSYVVLSNRDRHDPRKIEEILAAGYEVGIGFEIKFKKGTGEKGRGNIPPVVWFRGPDAVVDGPHWHAMLIVGYDHARQFFIVKNSYGPNLKGYDPTELPEGWKDIAKYRGFTLIHYSYVVGCVDACYITDVVDPASDHFHRQRAMGLWNVEFKQKSTGRKVASTVLAWRRLPGTDPKIAGDMRIGDFYCRGGQYRVNAQLTGKDPLAAYFYIDFRHPQTPCNEARGVRFYAVASLADNKTATMQITQAEANGNVEKLFGVPLNDLVGSGEQAIDENPLLQIPTPNLLANGSFEEGPSGDQNLRLDVGSAAIQGWAVTRGPVNVVDSAKRADLGSRCLDLHSSSGNGGVAQTFQTKPGRRYRVAFSLASTLSSAEGKQVAVSASGQRQEFAFEPTTRTAMHASWSTKTFEFTATEDQTALEIYCVAGADAAGSVAIDDVNVAPVVP